VDAQAVAGTAEEGDLRVRLVELTMDVAHAYLRWMDANTCDGMPYPRLRLLGLLHCGGPQMMRALGEQLGLTPRNMTALVDALEAEGLVVRQSHPSDRRAVLVELTDAGRHDADVALEARIAAVSAIFDALDEDEQRQFLAMLGALREQLRRQGVRA
jgi:DNA-binding MarR family transcriptional regulator